MSSGWSTDFDAAPIDTQLWVYATDDQGYGYGQAFIWKRGNPGPARLVWNVGNGVCDVNDGIERALMWHRLPSSPGVDALDAAAHAIRNPLPTENSNDK